MSGAEDFTIQYAIELPNGDMFVNPHNGAVVTWSAFDGAKGVYDQLVAQAQHMGMTFGGQIVHRYCSRFIGRADQAHHLIAELEQFLRAQGGGQ